MRRSLPGFRRAPVGLGAVAVAVVGLLLLAAPASAHVSVTPSQATQGESARVDFRVPNESDTATTVEVAVHFPEDAPVPSVSVGKVPGWSAEVAYRELPEPVQGSHGEQITEAVESITWTADDPAAEIGLGEFVEFPVGLGRLPAVDRLFFPTLQTYSDGEIVRWIDVPQGDVEPESPAPSLTLAAASDTPVTDPNGSAGQGDSAGGEQESSASGPGSGGSDAGMWLGLAALAVGLAGLALGGMAFTRTRNRAG
jgi:uncharacterized protein YcnI